MLTAVIFKDAARRVSAMQDADAFCFSIGLTN